MIIQTSAPGSFMLLGEHSVLRGKHAIVLALKQRLQVLIEPKDTPEIEIHSFRFGHYKSSLDNIVVEPPFHFILQTLKEFPSTIGLNITIDSDMRPTMGFGTSAAILVAFLGGLMTLEGQVDKHILFKRALRVVQKIQGVGSGADIAASLWGGIQLYRADPFFTQELEIPSDLFAMYTGFKTPTAEVVKLVNERFAPYPKVLEALDNTNDVLALEAAHYLQDPVRLGMFLNQGAGLMEALGVHTQFLSNLLWSLRDHAHGVKLSGSGLGDCAIGVSKNKIYPKGVFPVSVSQKGLIIEKSE